MRELAKLPEPPPPDPIEFAEGDDGDAVLLFLACDTQWRIDPTGRATGLLYDQVEATARMMDITMNTPLFVRVREMERAGLKSIADLVARRARRG